MSDKPEEYGLLAAIRKRDAEILRIGRLHAEANQKNDALSAALRAAEEETKETKAAWLRTLVETGEEMNRLDAQLAAVTARAEKAEEALELVAPAIHHAMCGVSIHVAACDTIRAALASAPEEDDEKESCALCEAEGAACPHLVDAPAGHGKGEGK